jgi:hypothetical protein
MEFTGIIVSAHLPSRDPIAVGLLVLDEATDRLHFRFRKDVDEISDAPESEVIWEIPELIESMATDMGARGVLLYLEEVASNTFRLGDRFTINAENAIEAIDRESAKLFT